MSVATKKVVKEIMICDSCGTDIEDDAAATRVEAKAEGFYKKDNFEFDLCVDCGSKFGLKRRGRKPASMRSESRTSATETQTATASSDDDWES